MLGKDSGLDLSSRFPSCNSVSIGGNNRRGADSEKESLLFMGPQIPQISQTGEFFGSMDWSVDSTPKTLPEHLMGRSLRLLF